MSLEGGPNCTQDLIEIGQSEPWVFSYYLNLFTFFSINLSRFYNVNYRVQYNNRLIAPNVSHSYNKTIKKSNFLTINVTRNDVFISYLYVLKIMKGTKGSLSLNEPRTDCFFAEASVEA